MVRSAWQAEVQRVTIELVENFNAGCTAAALRDAHFHEEDAEELLLKVKRNDSRLLRRGFYYSIHGFERDAPHHSRVSQ